MNGGTGERQDGDCAKGAAPSQSAAHRHEKAAVDRRCFLLTTGTLVTATTFASPAAAEGSAGWLGSLGHGFGLQLHDTSAATLDIAVNAGFTLIRTDFFWSGVENRRHVHDWTAMDSFVAALQARALRPVFVLRFNNPDVYGGAWMDGITMSFERNAYAAFCAAAAARYRDINPIWEMYNEPNRDTFWGPKANPENRCGWSGRPSRPCEWWNRRPSSVHLPSGTR